jgi:hypothetical protein
VNKNVLSVDSTLSPRQRKLLEEMGQHLEAGLVPLQIYNDRELYELEQERIFGRSWVFLAHESETQIRATTCSAASERTPG